MLSQAVQDLFAEPLGRPTFDKQYAKIFLYHNHLVDDTQNKQNPNKDTAKKSKKKKKQKKSNEINTPPPQTKINYCTNSLVLEENDPTLALPDRQVEKAHKWPAHRPKTTQQLSNLSTATSARVENKQQSFIVNPVSSTNTQPVPQPANLSPPPSKKDQSNSPNMSNASLKRHVWPVRKAPTDIGKDDLRNTTKKTKNVTDNQNQHEIDLLSSILPTNKRLDSKSLIKDKEQIQHDKRDKISSIKRDITTKMVDEATKRKSSYIDTGTAKIVDKAAKGPSSSVDGALPVLPIDEDEPLPPGVDSLSGGSSRSSSPSSFKDTESTMAKVEKTSPLRPPGDDDLLPPGVDEMEEDDDEFDENEPCPPGLEQDYKPSKKLNDKAVTHQKIDVKGRSSPSVITEKSSNISNAKKRKHDIDDKIVQKRHQPKRGALPVYSKSNTSEPNTNQNIVTRGQVKKIEGSMLDLVDARAPVEMLVASADQRKREIKNPESKNEEQRRKKKKKNSRNDTVSRNEYSRQRRLEKEKQDEIKRLEKLNPCPYFQKHGDCKYGDECRFSHDIKFEKRLECCKFYVSGACLKGDRCTYLHGEWPCKYYYLKKYCTLGDECLFSHADVIGEELKKAFLLRLEYENAVRDGGEQALQSEQIYQTSSSDTTVVEKLQQSHTIYDEKTNQPAVSTTQNSEVTGEANDSTTGEFNFPSLYYEL